MMERLKNKDTRPMPAGAMTPLAEDKTLQIRMFLLPNIDRFIRLVRDSKGRVMLIPPKGEALDLKENLAARELLRCVKPNAGGLLLGLTDPDDFRAYVRYMMEAALG